MNRYSVFLSSLALGTCLPSCTVFNYDYNDFREGTTGQELLKRCSSDNKSQNNQKYNNVAVLGEPCDPCQDYYEEHNSAATACINDSLVFCSRNDNGQWLWQNNYKCNEYNHDKICATSPNTNQAGCFETCEEDTIECHKAERLGYAEGTATFSYKKKCINSKEGDSIAIIDPSSVQICAPGATCSPKTGCSQVAYQLSGPAYTACGADGDIYEASIQSEYIIRYDNCKKFGQDTHCAVYQGVAGCYHDCPAKNADTTKGSCGGIYNIMSSPETCVKLDDGSYGYREDFLTKCSSCSMGKCKVKEEDKGLDLPVLATCDMYLTFPHCEDEHTLIYCYHGIMVSDHCNFSCFTNNIGDGWCDGNIHSRIETPD